MEEKKGLVERTRLSVESGVRRLLRLGFYKLTVLWFVTGLLQLALEEKFSLREESTISVGNFFIPLMVLSLLFCPFIVVILNCIEVFMNSTSVGLLVLVTSLVNVIVWMVLLIYLNVLLRVLWKLLGILIKYLLRPMCQIRGVSDAINGVNHIMAYVRTLRGHEAPNNTTYNGNRYSKSK
ncbi:uncharacterized protein LOC144447580 [Glandiceps talaboti]